MPTLLALGVSPRYDHSTSRKLTALFVKAWQMAHPGGQVIDRDLLKTHLPFVDAHWIGGAFTPPEQHSPESAAAIKVSNDLVAELKSADHIVIGTPMYNLAVPAALKAYIDHVVRVGVPVSSSNVGLLTGKKATVILASGGDFSPGSSVDASIKPVATFARCWPGSGSRMSSSFWPAVRAPGSRGTRPSRRSARRSASQRPPDMRLDRELS